MANGRAYPSETGKGSTPVPDPTILTTAALRREIEGLKELLEQRIEGIRDAFEQKFQLVERQRVEQKTDTKDALDAALQAAKDAVSLQTEASDKAIAKSENATNKALDQLATTFTTAVDALRREIGEVKERTSGIDLKVSGIEREKVGAKEDRTGIYATIGVLGTLFFIGLAIIGFLAAKGGP
jgi:hypothetical protein